MIAIELLRGIRKVIVHGREEGPCADGLAAALIVRNVLPDVIVEFVRYESPELRALPAEPGLLFLDITPPSERVDEFIQAGSLVIDHHATMAGLTELFTVVGRGAYSAEPGVSAATLAYLEVWEPLRNAECEGAFDRSMMHCEAEIAHFAALAGIYDTWKKDDPLWDVACEQAAILYFFPIREWLGDKDLFSGSSLDRKREFGAALVAQNRKRAEGLVAGVHRFTSRRGTRVGVLASSMISDAADLVEDVDLVIGFEFRVRGGEEASSRDGELSPSQSHLGTPSVKLAFRSRKGGPSVRPIAEALGGGGHDTAASVWLELATYPSHPYAMLASIYGTWEEQVL